MDTSVSDLALLASPFPLAQWTVLAMVELFRGNTSVLEDASPHSLKELTLVEPYLVYFLVFCVFFFVLGYGF